jgi:hypothetical protein
MNRNDLDDDARKDIEALIARMNPEFRQSLQSMAEGELIRLHRNYGMALRNEFRHQGFPGLLRYCSRAAPEERSLDAISAIAIREIWRHLRADRSG